MMLTIWAFADRGPHSTHHCLGTLHAAAATAAERRRPYGGCDIWWRWWW